MARGWESKSVEEQQAEASEPKLAPHLPVTPEEQQRRREIDLLHLALCRTQNNLAAATSDRYRQQLQSAIADLERKIAKLQHSSS